MAEINIINRNFTSRTDNQAFSPIIVKNVILNCKNFYYL